jgi:hypothetical protein
MATLQAGGPDPSPIGCERLLIGVSKSLEVAGVAHRC